MKRLHILSISMLIVLLSALQLSVEAQRASISRQTFSAAGGTFEFNSGQYRIHIQQSIGQTSVIGLYQRGAHGLRQGFLQPQLSRLGQAQRSVLEVSFFPNPFDSHFTIQCNSYQNETVSIVLMDLTGREVFMHQASSSPTIQVNPDHLTPGIYLLVVRSGTATFTSKIQQL